MKVILYGNGCPKCNVLTQKLKNAGINFEEISDIKIMISKGFMSMPMLEVDGEIMNFMEANTWINKEMK